MKRKLGKKQTLLILEAARRWLFSNENNRAMGLSGAWTGLGSASQYKPVVDVGLMEIATRPHPGFTTWWRLTAKGAAIIEKLLEAGLRREHFETDWTRNYMLAQQSGVSLKGFALPELVVE